MKKSNSILEERLFISNFLEKAFQLRLNSFFNNKTFPNLKRSFSLPKMDSPLLNFAREHKLSFEEFTTIALAIIPHFNPSFLGNIITNNLSASGDFPEIGGVKSDNNRYFLPTGETIMFLLAGTDLEKKAEVQFLFSSDHFFSKNELLHLESVKKGNPKTAGKIIIDEELLELFIYGKNSLPELSITFPAQHLKTQQEWTELILPENTLQQILEIKTWVQYQDTLMNDWGMSKKLKPGFRALFHGPPGTGKTLTATLLGKLTGLEVFRIDLSMIVSKYIGETEKNLASLFNKAQNKNWILFFDEADALFGKRTSVRDAHDKYANQEVSYLLQRIENYPGLVILASNFKANIDAAFTRRFHSIISFQMPSTDERFRIWQNAFPKKVKLGKDIDLKKLAEDFELTGSNIMNVVQYACLQALSKRKKMIRKEDILKGIRKEFEKEGKLL